MDISKVMIRPGEADDLLSLSDFDHGYLTDYVWQMDINSDEVEVAVRFREIRLPRSMRVEYPRDPRVLAKLWPARGNLLVAELENEIVGYANMLPDQIPGAVWVSDVVTLRRLRRQGIGTKLLLAVQAFARQHEHDRIILEMQSKNNPAIKVASKLGYEFSGYSDQYYSNHDIALFFTRRI